MKTIGNLYYLQLSLFLFIKINRSRAAFENILSRFLVYTLHEPKPVTKPSCGSIPSLKKLQVLILLKEYTLYVYFSEAVFPQKTECRCNLTF